VLIFLVKKNKIGGSVELKRRFNDDHDCDHDRVILVQLSLSSHIIASLDKTLYNYYLCLVASNKQQINLEQK